MLQKNITAERRTTQDDPNFDDVFVNQNEDYYEVNLNLKDESEINLDDDDSESANQYELEKYSYSDENIRSDC